MENLPSLCNDSLFVVQYYLTIRSLEDKGNLLFTIKIVEIIELHASVPSMRSADYKTTVPLQFLIIIHNYANVWTINQSKSLPGFWVVTSLDGINWPVDSDVAEGVKTT